MLPIKAKRAGYVEKIKRYVVNDLFFDLMLLVISVISFIFVTLFNMLEAAVEDDDFHIDDDGNKMPLTLIWMHKR